MEYQDIRLTREGHVAVVTLDRPARPAPTKRGDYGKMVGDFVPAVYNMRKPSIAAANGMCAGGGLSLIMACDIRICADDAKFSAVFVRRGLIPDIGATFFLPRLVGTANAALLAFTGDIIDARQAERMGLVTQVVPSAQLMPAAIDIAGRIAAGPPITIELAKKAIRLGLASNHLESQVVIELGLQRICNATEDHKEGTLSYVEKRQPKFQGR